MVIGLGGVGLSVVAAARAAGAAAVIAVDVSEAKKALAEAAGATDFLVSSDALSKDDPRPHRRAAAPTTPSSAWAGRRRSGPRGGPPAAAARSPSSAWAAADDMVQLSALDIFSSARTLRSSVYGSSDPDVRSRRWPRTCCPARSRLDHLITDRIGAGRRARRRSTGWPAARAPARSSLAIARSGAARQDAPWGGRCMASPPTIRSITAMRAAR